MKLNDIREPKGARKRAMRVGRGIGSGKGKTAGRGGKGQTARSGVAIKGFEGGQMPLHRRIPKRGFSNIFRQRRAEVNLGRIEAAIGNKRLDAGKTITEAALVEAGLAKAYAGGVKVLAKGTLKSKLTLEVTAASAGAIRAIEKAGGKITVLKPKVEKPAAEKAASVKPGAKAEPKPEPKAEPAAKPASDAPAV
jgi:large subunit ribosomal protein L15